MSTVYAVRIIKCDNPSSWAADKIGLIFDALKVGHHNSLEKRMIFLGVEPEHGWIYEDEGEILSWKAENEMFVSKIDPPRLPELVRPL